MSEHLELTALVFREGSWYYAQVIEHDILAESRAEEGLADALRHEIAKETKNGSVSRFSPAPEKTVNRILRFGHPKTLRVTVDIDKDDLRVEMALDRESALNPC